MHCSSWTRRPFRLSCRLLVNNYDLTSAPPDDVGRQKGCKVRIARDPGTIAQESGLLSWHGLCTGLLNRSGWEFLVA